MIFIRVYKDSPWIMILEAESGKYLLSYDLAQKIPIFIRITYSVDSYYEEVRL